MPSTYSKNLGLELMATGENPGTWGEVTNINLQAVDDAINGLTNVSVGAGGTTIVTDHTPAMSQGRSKIITFDGNLGTTPPDAPYPSAVITIAPNDAEIWYHMRNTTNGSLKFQQGSGSAYELAPGYSALIHCNGGGSAASVFGTLSSIQANRLLVRADPALPAGYGTGEARIDGNASVGGSLTVAGAVTLTGAVSAGSLNITPGNLDVAGTSAPHGLVTCSAGVNVTGPVNITGAVEVTGTLAASGTIGGGALVSGTTLTVGGIATLNGAVNVAGVLSANGNLVINTGSDAAWDMYTRGVASNLNRIPIGAVGQYLRVSAGNTPQWQPLTVPVGTPVTGGTDGSVPYFWGGVLTQGGITTTQTGAVIQVKGGDANYGSALVLDSNFPNAANVVRYSQQGKTRWDMASRNVGASKATWYLQRYVYKAEGAAADGAPISFEMIRENGHLLIGYIDFNNIAGCVNVAPASPAEKGLIIRRHPPGGQTANLLEFQDEAGNPLGWVDKDGRWGQGGTAAWLYMGRTSLYSMGQDINTGAMFFYQPSNLMAGAGGYLSFSYGLGGTYASLWAVCPPNPGQTAAPVQWFVRGNSLPPYTVAAEELQRISAESVLDNLLPHPDLLLRLKEALAAV